MENPKWKTPASNAGEEFEMIAKTFQGLETVLATELIDLGANNIQIGRRMVSFTGNKELLYRANFQLRTAIRILMPIKHFRATSADEVYEAVQQIDWTNYLTNETTFAVDSVVFSQEFRHSKFVAYKVKDAIVDQMRERTGERPNIRVTNPDLQLHIHIAEYECTLSLDTSGESLHRRGYRQETVEAPLNEVLAAGIIMLTGWKGECDLIDPMCGSGTILIEAAQKALKIAPGINRYFSCEKWICVPEGVFERERELAKSRENLDCTFRAEGYDIDPEALKTAEQNAKIAGVGDRISFSLRDIKDYVQPEGYSTLITNPPYGERLLDITEAEKLYKIMGEKFVREKGKSYTIITPDDDFEKIFGRKADKRRKTYNGTLKCQIYMYFK